MHTFISREEHEVIGTNQLPAISIVLPFEPKMSLKTEAEYRLKMAMGKVEKELHANYPAEKTGPVLNKLHKLVSGLNFNTHKKSVAIFVSPTVEKVFYLDVPVEEKIIVDESFEIRDLIYSKKQNVQYLILLLSGKASKTYLADSSKFSLIKSNVPGFTRAFERDMPERVTHFSDQNKHKENLIDAFLHHMDEGLTLILKAYSLPVFVLGAEKVLGHFKKLTRNKKNIVQYIHGSYEDSSESQIREIMLPYTLEWKKIMQQAVLQEIEKAMDDNKLVFGIHEVWQAAVHKNGRLLVVEKDFLFPAHHGLVADSIYKEDLRLNNPFYIKDAVDDVMEKILENGGDVEFVENGALENYGHIALVTTHKPFF